MLYAATSGAESSPDQPSNPHCLKKVLERFCLGGKVEELPAPDKVDGNKYFYSDNGNPVMIETAGGRIASVRIFFSDPSWPSYRALLEQLQQKYGSGITMDSFPEDAGDDASKAAAIERGRGRAMTAWQQTGWFVSYAWATSEYRILQYGDDELMQALESRMTDRSQD